MNRVLLVVLLSLVAVRILMFEAQCCPFKLGIPFCRVLVLPMVLTDKLAAYALACT